MKPKFNAYSTTNATYGNFYEDIKAKVKDDQERHKRLSNQYQNSYQDIETKFLNNYKNYNYYHKKAGFNTTTINNASLNFIRARTPNLLLKDSSIVGNFSSSLTGLMNLGNTCYINTCLQILIHCTPFISKFLEMSNKMFQKKIRPSPISDAFYELLIQIYENNNQIDYIDPNIFVEKMTSLHRHFYGNQQHDAQEFCRFLLQDFNCELNEVENPSSYRNEIAYNKDKRQMFINYKNDCLSKENSFITDLFIGYFSFEYTCECGFKEYSFSQFLDLPVQMDPGFHRFDLLQMLKNTFKKKSIVDMAENCAVCNRTSHKTEMMRIASLPQILIISLQRINPDNGKKNNSPVNFTESMDLTQIIDTDISDNYSSIYNLFAVTNHVGEINTGHYFSYIKIGNIWFCFEDIRVYKIGPHIDLTSKEIYTLFYMRSNYY